jgi:tetratricopeptide (TPR) repeat protein
MTEKDTMMTTGILAGLDQDELLRLALDASAQGQGGAAIAYLKEAVGRVDATAFAHFLLGAEYAQIKLYERAAGEMEAALALDPGLSVARLQLGLLWLTGAQADKAALTLAPLAELPPADPMRLFGAGLEHLMHDRFDDATAALQSGIQANTANDHLNGEMQLILDEIARLRGAGHPPGVTQAQPASATQPKVEGEGKNENESESAANHLFLSAYTGNQSRH